MSIRLCTLMQCEFGYRKWRNLSCAVGPAKRSCCWQVELPCQPNAFKQPKNMRFQQWSNRGTYLKGNLCFFVGERPAKICLQNINCRILAPQRVALCGQDTRDPFGICFLHIHGPYTEFTWAIGKMTYTVLGSGQINSHNMLHLCTQHNLAIIYLQCFGATMKNIHALQHIQTNCSIEFGSDNFPTIYIII
jgi:hypothetical protein